MQSNTAKSRNVQNEYWVESPWALTSDDSALFKFWGSPDAKQHCKQPKRAERVLGGIPLGFD